MANKPFPAMSGRSLTIPLDIPATPKPMPKPMATRVTPKPMPKPAVVRGSAPTAAERAASRKQDESLKKAKVTKQEGRVIESANRSEGSGKKPMKMAKGGKATKFGAAMKKKSADTMGRAMKMNKGGKCYAAGGLASGHKAANGIAKKGLTKGTQVKMAKGGRMKGCK